MLRRRPDNTFEFRDIERMLYAAQPPSLAPDRRDALRLRIMASLGEQDELHRTGTLTPVFRERWVAVPVGVGLAVAIISGINAYNAHYLNDGRVTEATFAGQLSLDGASVGEIRPGPTFVAVVETNVHLGDEVVVGLEKGTSFSYATSQDGDITVFPGLGVTTIVTGTHATDVAGSGWSARLGADSAATFTTMNDMLTIEGQAGVVSVAASGGQRRALSANDVMTFRIGDHTPDPASMPPADPPSANGAGHSPGGSGKPFIAERGDAGPTDSQTSANPGTAEPSPAAGNGASNANPPPQLVQQHTPPELAPGAPAADVPPEAPPEPPVASAPTVDPPGLGGDLSAPPQSGPPDEPGSGKNGLGGPPAGGPAPDPPGGGQPENTGGLANGGNSASASSSLEGETAAVTSVVDESADSPETAPSVEVAAVPGNGVGNPLGPENSNGNGPSSNSGQGSQSNSGNSAASNSGNREGNKK